MTFTKLTPEDKQKLLLQLLQEKRNGASQVTPDCYKFEQWSEYQQLQQRLQQVTELGIGNPYFKVHNGLNNHYTDIGDQQLVNYSSYNYLGLSGEPRVSQATKAAIDRYGTSVSASRLISGERPLHRELETAIARLVRTEDSIVYVGGHSTNVTTLGHLFDKEDLIIHDSLIHNCVQEGSRLSGAKIIPFPHNNWQALDNILAHERVNYRRVLIVIEGIYSMDGDIPNLPEFIKLKKQHHCWLMIDEAHSIGVLGAKGGGIGDYYQVNAQDVDMWMGTLSKAFASCGGYIAGSKAIIEYLKYTAPGFVYSVGISPPNAAAALAAIQVLEEQPERIQMLEENARYFLNLARDYGFNTGTSDQTPVIPIIIGDSLRCMQLAEALFTQGINVQPMVYPSVAENGARLRFFLSTTHTREQIEYTLKALKEKLDQLQN